MADQSALVAKLRTLTPRQLEVLSLLNKGFLHKEIAQQLHITEQGVVYHVTRIYQKLGIKDLPSGPRRIELGKYCSVLPYLSLNQLPQPDSERGEASGVMHEDNDELADQDTPPNSGGSDEPSQEALAIIQVLQAVIEDEAVLAVRDEPGVLARRPVTYGSWWRAAPRRPKFQAHVLPFVLVALVSLLVGSGGTMLAIQWPLNNQTIAGGPTTTGTFDSSPLQATGAATSLAPSPSSAPTTIVEAAGVCGSAQPRIPEAPAARFVRDQGVSLFTPDNTNNGVLTQRVRALALDERGVWIGYFATDQLPSGGLGQYNKQEWTNCNNAAAVAGVNVNALAFDQRGQLWVATEKHGITMFDGELWHTYTVTNTKQLRNNETFGITVDQRFDIDQICFERVEGQPNQPICPSLSQSTDTITVTNPIALTSGDRFRVAVVVRPRAPYQLRIGDFLSNTDRDDFHLFGAHINMPVTEVVEPGAPYTLISPDNPFQAPLLDTSKIEQTFVSNWRLWMHGRYAGPTIRIQFTVHNQKQPGG